jgi:translation initiation factor IF-2
MNVEPIVSGPMGMSSGQIVPGGQIVSGPMAAPSVEPPAPRPANGPAASDSPPAAPGPDSATPGNTSAGPLDLPLPPADSPFGGPAPN